MYQLNEIPQIERDIKKKLNTGKLKSLNTKISLRVMEVTPYELLSCRRFDIMAKYIYGWFKENNINSSWALRLYDEHIRVFNNYDEGDSSAKKGINCFIESFNSILQSIKDNGFDDKITLIPIGKNNEPLDGAHRLAAALVYGKNVKTVKFNEAEANYNYNFFTDRGLDSLETKYCDAIAYEYCKMKPNTYIVMIFPSAVGKRDDVRRILKKYGDIFYEKNIKIGNRGPRNLIIQLYKNEQWIGSHENDYKGAQEKFDACFKGRGPLTVYLFEAKDASTNILAKQEIRDLYNIGKHSAHINDTHEETIELAQLLFNENSIYFLNNANPYKFQKFYKLLNEYKRFLSEREPDKEYFCVDAKSVLSAYGICDCSDLAFLCYKHENIDLEGFDNISSIGDALRYHPKAKSDIIFNPENHFYFEGVKFASIDVVKEIKQNSGETKDKLDLCLIRKYLNNQSRLFRFRIFLDNLKKVISKITGKIVRDLYKLIKKHS